jgi:acyl-CoA synthetase (AMP-forming)/AMP-acid ligase II
VQRALMSVSEVLTRSARDHPDRPAVLTGGRSWSYAELRDAAHATAAGLQRAGVGVGEPVVVAIPNQAEFFVAFFGVLLAGAVAVPVFPGATPERLAALARTAGAGTVLKPGSVPGLITCAGKVRPAPDDPDRPCYIQYTSGSTANPRGVVLTHRNVLANIGQMTEAMEITSDDVFVSWLPTYHDMGLTLMALTPFALGTRLVLLPTDLRDITGWLRAIEAQRGTFTAGPDFAYRLCLRNVSEPGRFDLSSLRVCMNAAEPVRAATLSGFEAAFALRHVMMAGYGLAEATLAVTCTQRGQPIHIDERGLVCLGRPVPGTNVRITSDGEIVVAGPSTCAGYHRNPAETAALAAGNPALAGYLRTGDLGYLDQQGRLYFTARRKDVVNVAGRTLYPQEIESRVDEVPGVRVSAAAGIDRGAIEGEQLYVFAEARAAATASPDDLQTLVVEITWAVHGALGVRPRSTLLLRPRTIPMTANGKLRRAALRDAYADGRIEVIFP